MIDGGVPAVSVVICSFNHEDYVIESLESVASQSILPDQLVVADDASVDGSVHLIQSWVKKNWPAAELLLSSVNQGLPRTLNKAVPLVRGEFVAIMSADDRMVPTRIERQLEAFAEGGPSVGMVYSDMTEMDEHGTPTGQRWFDADRMGPVPGSGNLFESMIRRASMAAPTVMVRRELLQTVGPYDESLVAEDYDMFLRLSRLATWSYVADPLVDYRVLSSSLSRSESFLGPKREARIRLLRKHVGVSKQTDRIIADRTAQMATGLYYEGRPGWSTSPDLLRALKVRPRLRDAILFVLATFRIPGPLVARSIATRQAAARRVRGVRKLVRSGL